MVWHTVLLFLPITAMAERQFSNVLFSKELCADLGYADKFDVCGKMEFCQGNGQRRKLANPFDHNVENPDEVFKEDVEVAQIESELMKFEDSGTAGTDDVYNTPADQIEESDDLENEEFNDQEFQDDESLYLNNSDAGYGWRVPGGVCSAPGPVMRLKRGLKHGLFVQGGSAPTNLHFHGLHIAGHGNGDDLRRKVQGDDVLVYELNLPASQHMGGTYWYHSHLEGSAWDQVKGGAFGMIVVEENGHDVGTQDENVLGFLENERILILDDTYDEWKANGIASFADTYKVVKDEWYRLRVMIVSVDSYIADVKIKFGDACEVRPIAYDGIMKFLVPGAEAKLEYALTTSSRLDVAIKCQANADIGINRGNAEIMANIIVDDSKKASSVSPFENGQQQWKSSRLSYTEDLRSMDADNEWTVKVDETNINGVNSGQHEPLCSENGGDFQYGSVQEWRIKGANTHPFHLHTFPMQVVSGCGKIHQEGEFYDTIVTKGHHGSKQCLVRIKLADVAGPTTVHCHIFEHAEHGALAYLYVDGGPKQPEEPNFSICKSGSCDNRKPLLKCSDMR